MNGPGFGPGGGGYPLFGDMQLPTSSAYAASLYMDGYISDGLGQIGRSQREARRLMMLFFYYARMAESGDLGAMYQFMRFITYVISKDKARQTIKLTTLILREQDKSKKALDDLFKLDGASTDPAQQAEFTKTLHRTKAIETETATNQKLGADMIQEFGHVTEALNNSLRFMLDAWGRVLRNASSR